MRRLYINVVSSLALTVLFASPTARGQSVQVQKVDPQPEPLVATVQGVVRDSLNLPVAVSKVPLKGHGSQIPTAQTELAGSYFFRGGPQGSFPPQGGNAGP